MIQRLKEIRMEKNLSQKEIASYLQVSQQTYSDYEKGRTNPDISTLILMANILETSTDYLLGREDDLGNIVTQNETATPQLSESEQKLLNSFRRLPPGLQDRVLAYVDGLDDAIHPKDKKNFG